MRRFNIRSVSYLLALPLLVAACNHSMKKNDAVARDGYSANDGGYKNESNRDVASVTPKHKRRVHANAQTCKAAFESGMKSPSTMDVFASAEICTAAAEAVCNSLIERNDDGSSTGDSRYIAASCEMRAAAGALNAVAGKSKSSSDSADCKKAVEDASKSPSTGDVNAATEVCNTAKDKACMAMVKEQNDGGEQTGDGRLVAAICDLSAAHGSWLAVSKK